MFLVETILEFILLDLMFKVVLTISFVDASFFLLVDASQYKRTLSDEQLPLMPSYVGVTAVCDDLKVTYDPQLALPVAELVQHKMAEAGSGGLNLSKCRILIHPDSADLVVVWPSTLPPPTYPLLRWSQRV